MLYRIAIVETTSHKWVVYKIRYQRLKNRMAIEHFVGDMLGTPFDTLFKATTFAEEVYHVLARIQTQQGIVDDRNEDEYIKLQSRSNIVSLLRELSALTGVKHP